MQKQEIEGFCSEGSKPQFIKSRSQVSAQLPAQQNSNKS